jgi:hypothetical protein
MAMLPPWLQYLQAGAVILIPLIGAWIAWQQVQIARAKLHFDLYEKRFAVFEAARSLIGEAIRSANLTTSSLNAYTLGTADAVFLLSDDVNKYLRDVAKHAVALSTMQYAIEPLPVGSQQRVDMSEKIGEETLWFNNQLDELIAHFRPFLKLDEPKRRR